MKPLEKKVLVCPECGSRQVYTLISMTHVCRRCGHRWQEKQIEKSKKKKAI